MPQMPSVQSRFFFKWQMVHLLSLILLLVGAFLLVDFKQLRDRQILGVGAQVWFIISLAVL